MKKLLIYISIGTLYCTNAYCLSTPSTCPGDSIETETITGGKRTITICSQTMPNCSNTKCMCCIKSPIVKCTCDNGYYEGTDLLDMCTCEKCPVANSTCTSATSFKCNANYYKNGNTCSPCPQSGKSATGSTAITSCYLPSGTTGSDTTGTYKYTADCYYQN
ncbi:MAG: hypothetical protein NC311_03570 [Muribaculaceae bacterium]|nr:hypothetical protein [Muribaculaceae bacterium]